MSQTPRPQFDAIGLGALNMDFLYRVDRIVIDGETVIQESRQAPGGSAANTIYGLAKLGLKTGFAGAVGDDASGRAMLDDLSGLGADTTRIKIKRGSNSGAVFALTDNEGHRSLYILPGANSRLNAADISMGYFSRARLLHLSSFVDEAQFQLSLQAVQSLAGNVLLSFSPGALYVNRGMDAIAPFLARAEVLFLNADELSRLTGLDLAGGTAVCQAAGCHTIVVTLGSGRQLIGPGSAPVTAVAYIRDRSGQHLVPPSPEAGPPIDTTGAGDAFAAGFLYGLLKDKPVDVRGRLGDLAAQFSLKQTGARAGLPTLADLSTRYLELYGEEL